MRSPTGSEPKRPSTWRVFNNDPSTYVAAVIGGGAVLIAFIIGNGRFPSDPSELLVFVATIAIAILFFLYFAWRVHLISSLVTQGEEVKARVSDVSF